MRVSLALLASLALACSSNDSSGPATGGSGGTTASGGSAGSDCSGTGGITTSDCKPCNAASYQEACQLCCAWPDAPRDAYLGYVKTHCQCTAGAVCYAACSSSLCAGQPSSSECDACVTSGDVCEGAAKADCAADPVCKPLADCMSTCDGLPKGF